MRRRWIWIGAGVVLAVAIAAGAAVLLTGDSSESSPGEPAPLHASTSISPRIAVFGDTIRAQVDVTLDPRRVDPDTVRVRAAFKQWRHVAPAQLVRSQAGNVAHLRAVYQLRCLRLGCTPGRDTIVFDFDPARVEYTDRVGGKPEAVVERTPWPRVIIHTRVAAGDLASSRSPYRADLTALPAPTYRASPGALVALLSAGAIVLAVGGAVLAFFGWPRRVPEVVPEPEPVRDPGLSPLERALELLEDAARANSGNGTVPGTAQGAVAEAADRRRSLELVAEVLAERGADDSLARTAQELAWSPATPPVDATKALAARVRATLEEELRRLEEERLRELREQEEAHAQAG
jgi:hypothetical protein